MKTKFEPAKVLFKKLIFQGDRGTRGIRLGRSNLGNKYSEDWNFGGEAFGGDVKT